MDDLVIIGLPSSGLVKLTSVLGVRHIEDADVLRAQDHPQEVCDMTPEGIVSRWARYLAEDGGCSKGILVYQTPWGSLERQFRASSAVPRVGSELGSYARGALRFWHTYHFALYTLHRNSDGQFILVNGDRPIDVDAIVNLLNERFNLQPAFAEGLRPSNGDHATTELTEVFSEAVDALAPECVDLYRELESCAQLMGRQPEFEHGCGSRREAELFEMMRVLIFQDRIRRLLDGYSDHSGDPAADLEKALETRLEGMNGQSAKLREVAKQAQDQLAASEARIEALRDEKELYLLQLHQIQEELEYYFALNQDKDQQLAALQQGLQLQSAPLTRKLIHRVFNTKDGPADSTGAVGRLARGWLAPINQRRRILSRQVKSIRASGLFDENWYLQRYPDVARAGIDPVEHYLEFGVAEGRNPSPYFDTRWYLEAYVDVAQAKMNPLLHYIEYGRNEGRKPARFLP